MAGGLRSPARAVEHPGGQEGAGSGPGRTCQARARDEARGQRRWACRGQGRGPRAVVGLGNGTLGGPRGLEPLRALV